MFQSLSAALGFAPRVTQPFTWGSFAEAVRVAVRAHTTRQDLPELSDHLLADIGVTRKAALAEAERAPWDLEPQRAWRG